MQDSPAFADGIPQIISAFLTIWSVFCFYGLSLFSGVEALLFVIFYLCVSFVTCNSRMLYVS